MSIVVQPAPAGAFYAGHPVPAMVARLVLLPARGPWEALARRVALLSRSRSVLVVTVRLPRDAARRQLEEAGADLAHVFLLDVAAQPLGAPVADPEHEAMVPNPSLLELITARTAAIVRSKAERPATVVVDDAQTFALYNPAHALVQIVDYAVNHLLSDGNDLEYVVPPTLALAKLAPFRDLVPDWRAVLPDGTLGERVAPAAG